MRVASVEGRALYGRIGQSPTAFVLNTRASTRRRLCPLERHDLRGDPELLRSISPRYSADHPNIADIERCGCDGDDGWYRELRRLIVTARS
jgi:hypothetical protein